MHLGAYGLPNRSVARNEAGHASERAASLLVAEEEEPELEAVRVSEREVLAELQRVRNPLESLESRISRRPAAD